MLHWMSQFGVLLLVLFFAVTGAWMLVSPQGYFRQLGRLAGRGHLINGGQGRRWKMIEIWTRVRGAMLLAALGWVVYRGFAGGFLGGFLKIR